MAFDCNSTSRSARGSSWSLNNSSTHQISVAIVAKARMKKMTAVSMVSDPDVGELANHQNAHALGNDGVRQEFTAHRIRVKQLDVLRLEDPETQGDHQRHAAKQSGGKALL